MSHDTPPSGERDGGSVRSRSRSRGKNFPPPDTLVAIVNSLRDFERARDDGWYRIPVEKCPPAMLEGQIHTLAFYLPKTFGADAFTVAYAAPVTGISTHLRRELLPDESHHPRADMMYVRVGLGHVRRLAHPIPSQRQRRIVHIPTTQAKLEAAREINDLYHDSPLEDAVWAAFKAEGIEAERQYYVPGDDSGLYALDFAVFGQQRNLDVECDGDRYHANPAKAASDNQRNNFLGARGWTVLRFSTSQVEHRLSNVVAVVRTAMKHCDAPPHVEPQHAPAPPSDLLWQSALWSPDVAYGHTVDPHRPKRRHRRT